MKTLTSFPALFSLLLALILILPLTCNQAVGQTNEFVIIRQPTPNQSPANTTSPTAPGTTVPASNAPTPASGSPPASPPGGGPPPPLQTETLPPPPPPKPVDRLTIEKARIDQQISQTIISIQSKQREIDTEIYQVYRAPLILQKQFLEQHLEDLRQQRDNLESQKFTKDTKEQMRKQQNQ